MSNLCKQITFLKNNLTIYDASFILLYEIKCVILENQPITTKIESWL